ncbi:MULTISPECIES: heavy metal translocating P-type ATPase [Halomonadaceae]|jgi:Zn2+/Cd2+-exporting ATPase|uniref:heavy metal translocating P-type ATPase n=1 Tax=Halomonadaceae TaxID=28256 RepID=UPI0012F2B98C|nr:MULTISPECIES: heavy metal translocating P-type ATPase [Halomonas]CAD5252535.1 Zinc/cadmium/lead-transporting P-type ATPase [Halomonas sp. 113]CAD5252602.1 Zinc/cadmium/lead-transporting P-type ATPase [Halomonas sp. 59]CAD5260644.1 Zinc/cadmium/lead-transporting P-type ATPase [Halomonas sp. I3]CAD5294955.1 Zinc/cadmium/lead-transporting P-type ATPase [Halomonas sp. 156]VXB09859.1 Zinc/cadmium/lead-transporting P-type ATPase [Halomonas titanicae]
MSTTTPAKTSAVSPSPTTLRVQGMDCGGCERKVEAALNRLNHVEHVSASSVTGSVRLTAPPGKTLPHSDIESTITALGYQVIDESVNTTESEKSSSWWQSPKGRLVIVSGVLLALAWGLKFAWPTLGSWPFIAATVVGLVPVIQRAWQALKMGNPFTIEMLMSIAALGALAINAAAEAAVVVFLFAVGEMLEGVAAAQARRSISALSKLTPSTARLMEQGEAREVAAASLVPGQRVQVRPGDRLPCDGQIIAGHSSIDESPVNGESVPRERSEGESVFAGTVNLDGVLEVEVTRSAENNTIARVIKLVEEAQAAKAPVARFIDRFAFYYMPAVVGVALLVAIVPPLVSTMLWSESIYRALALLLIACPCALVISTPAAIAAGLSVGARNGLLMKGGAVLEQLGKLKRVALDKTGTLTAGKPTVTDVESLEAGSRLDKSRCAEIVRLAAALEQGSSHPLAVAISDYYDRQEGASVPTVQGARALAGQGVAGHVEGRELMLVSPRYLQSFTQHTGEIKARIAALEAQGKSLAVLIEIGIEGEDGIESERLLGLIALRDEPREDAREGLQALERLGVQAVMLSGDNARTVAAIGEQLGIEAEGELMPEDKAQRVREWQAQGLGPVGKVGDGINDAPALAAAEVGIAMGSGTDVALETADAALLKNRVGGIAEMIALSRATMRNVKTNVALALGFKALFLVSTVLGITGMWVAVMADTGATVLVTLNALYLLRYRFNEIG